MAVLTQLLRMNYRFLREHMQRPKPATLTDPYSSRAVIESLFNDHEVLHGPFKGLKYSSFEAVCSSVYPKLLGSYEQEIQEEIAQVIHMKPRLIIDIGCAEGYYAVGLARALPQSQIIAADTSETAQRLCSASAMLNECNNITITGTIDVQKLLETDLNGAFILCDCEGYEKELFTAPLLDALKYTSLIIETHDFIDPTISEYLEHYFRNSHQIKVISSMDDLLKAKYYDYPELRNQSKKEKIEILAEYRPSIMEWLILRPNA